MLTESSGPFDVGTYGRLGAPRSFRPTIMISRSQPPCRNPDALRRRNSPTLDFPTLTPSLVTIPLTFTVNTSNLSCCLPERTLSGRLSPATSKYRYCATVARSINLAFAAPPPPLPLPYPSSTRSIMMNAQRSIVIDWQGSKNLPIGFNPPYRVLCPSTQIRNTSTN